MLCGLGLVTTVTVKDPKHTVNAVKTYLERKRKLTSEHYQSWISLPKNLDLNIIDAVWDPLDRE